MIMMMMMMYLPPCGLNQSLIWNDGHVVREELGGGF
jgi:hypothetical protein